jgi:hypothetical protein
MKITNPKGGGIWSRWKIEVRDKNGIVVCHRQGPSHSFVHNFGLFIRAIFDAPSGQTNPIMTDSGGVSRKPRVLTHLELNNNSTALLSASAIMRFGASAVAEDATHIDIQGAELESGGTVTETSISETSVETEFEVQGSVTNTGATFTVEELGLFMQMKDEVNVARDVMILRDLLQTGPATVLNGQTITGTYNFVIPV